MVGARVISVLTNFTVNRMLMHEGGARPSASSSLVRYAVLAVGILAANAALMEALIGLGASLLVAKILPELILIPISFAVQRRWVFLPTQRQEKYARKDSGDRRLFRLARGELRAGSHGGCKHSCRNACLPGTPLATSSLGATYKTSPTHQS